MKYDYIIVGQGIAGSVLAFLLLKKGKNVLVIDDGHKTSSSLVAAGMWNPISFKRTIASWNFDRLYQAATEVYTEIEKSLGISFFHPKELVRIFPDNISANEWDIKSSSLELGKFLSNNVDPLVKDQFHNPFGHGIVRQAGHANVSLFINEFRKNLLQAGNLRTEKFDFRQLKISAAQLVYGEIVSDKIVFCTGSLNFANPYFNGLPVAPNKGQLLTVRIKNLTLDKIVNHGQFIIPLGNDLFRIGSTNEFGEIDSVPTESVKNEILHNLQKVIASDVEVVDHQAGLRPGTKDRRPFIGNHPHYKNVFMMNGLGSKGVIIAPWLARQLIHHFETGIEIEREVNLMRYWFV